MPDFVDTLTFLTDQQRGTLREQDLVAAEDFAHVTLARLEAPPYSLSTGKASRVLRTAGGSTVGPAPVTNITVTHAEPPSLANRIDAALLAAREDVAAAGLLVWLGVPLVVLAADDKIDVEATKAMRQHVASGAPSGATWQGQRIASTETLSLPPIWCSPRTQKPLQAGKDEVTEVPWAELRLDGLREAAFGYREGMFVGVPDEAVFRRVKDDELGIRAKIQARMKALGVRPEEMDALVVFQRPVLHDSAQWRVEPRPLGQPRVSAGSLVSNLSNLLLRIFDAGELRRFLRYLPGGADIVAELPGPDAPPSQFATAAVEHLQRLGLVRRDLRDRLVAERPRRVDEIDQVFSAAGV